MRLGALKFLAVFGFVAFVSYGFWGSPIMWAELGQSPLRQTVPSRVPTRQPTSPVAPTPAPTNVPGPSPQNSPTPIPATLTPAPTNVPEPSPQNSPTPIPATWIPTQVITLTPVVPLATGTAMPPPLVIPVGSLTPVPTRAPVPVPPSVLQVATQPLPSALYNKILFRSGPRSAPSVWVMDPDGSNVGLLTQPELYPIAKARDSFSPGFIKQAYNAVDPNGILQVWSQDLYYPQSLAQPLTFLRKGYAFAPAWSPDGKKIAYVVNDGALWPVQEIYVWDWDAKKSLRLTDSTGNSTGYGTGWWWNQFPSWSPDGKQMVYSSDRGHDAMFSEIWIMNADGTSPRNLGNGVWDAYEPVWIKWEK